MRIVKLAVAMTVLVLAACGPAPVATTGTAEEGSAGAEGGGAGAGEGERAGEGAGEGESAGAGEGEGVAEGAEEGEGEGAGEGVSGEPAAPTACSVSGRAIATEVNVAIEGGTPIAFASVTGVMTATVPERRAATRVVVTDPLAFEGETRAPVQYAIARPIDVASETIHLAPATPVTRVAPDAGNVRVDVDLADGVSVRDLPLPCGALSLRTTAPAVPPAVAEEGLISRGGTLALFTGPGEETAAVTVRLSRPTEVVLSETSRRDGWVRVWRSFDTGASLNGWVPESAVRALTRPPRPRASPDRVVRERIHSECERRVAGYYMGPARVAAGTEVRTEAGGGVVWARTVMRDVTVRTLENPEWVVLESVDGVLLAGRCPARLQGAFIPRASVTFPSQTGFPGAMPE